MSFKQKIDYFIKSFYSISFSVGSFTGDKFLEVPSSGQTFQRLLPPTAMRPPTPNELFLINEWSFYFSEEGIH